MMPERLQRCKGTLGIIKKLDRKSLKVKVIRKKDSHSTRLRTSYICLEEGCNKKFRKKANLKFHLRKHLNFKGFFCFDCGGNYSTQATLDRHREAIHFATELQR
jgi:hypothetical protein